MQLQGFGWDGYGLDQSGSRQGKLLGSCECGDEPPGSIKCEEFLDQLRNGQLLRKDSVQGSQLFTIYSLLTNCTARIGLFDRAVRAEFLLLGRPYFWDISIGQCFEDIASSRKLEPFSRYSVQKHMCFGHRLLLKKNMFPELDLIVIQCSRNTVIIRQLEFSLF